MAIELKVPDIGDFKEVEVIEILVAVGDTIKAEQSLITVESDKSSMEIPAEQGGVVKAIKVKVGDKVSEGSVLLDIDAAEGAAASPARQSGSGSPGVSASVRRARGRVWSIVTGRSIERLGASARTIHAPSGEARTNMSAIPPWGTKSTVPVSLLSVTRRSSLPPDAAMTSPDASFGSHSCFCASLPPAAIARAGMARPSRGRAATCAPAASAIVANSTSPRPEPPWASGTAIPARPSSVQKLVHNSRSIPSPSIARRVRSLVAFSAKKARAVSAIIACSSVKANCIRRSPTPCAGRSARRAARPPPRRRRPGSSACRHRPSGLRASRPPA